MDKIINTIKQHKLKTFLIILFIFLVPLAIVQILFKWHSGQSFIEAEWSAGDLISYIASFLVLFSTIVLGIITLQLSQKSNEINIRLLELQKNNDDIQRTFRRCGISLKSINTLNPYGNLFDGERIVLEIENLQNNVILRLFRTSLTITREKKYINVDNIDNKSYFSDDKVDFGTLTQNNTLEDIINLQNCTISTDSNSSILNSEFTEYYHIIAEYSAINMWDETSNISFDISTANNAIVRFSLTYIESN